MFLKRIIVTVSLVLLAFVLSACAQEGDYRRITAEEARAIMEQEEPYILLDVRTEEEFLENHIEGAMLIPDYEIGDKAALLLPQKDSLILIYCRSGRRSALAAKDLIALGYTHVYDFGGIIDWPYETISAQKEQ